MASPPFNINQSLPGDSDIVSQHPANARTFRDITESWFLVDGNNMGRKNKVSFDHQDDDPTGTADVTTVWADEDGYLMFRRGTGNPIYLEEAPGTVKFTAASSAPEGWLLCDGSTVSRTTYARLFAAIGATYGAGDGSTTFVLPPAPERALVGKASTATLLTSALGGVDGGTLGSTGGVQNRTLTVSHLPDHIITLTDPGHAHTYTARLGVISAGDGGNILSSSANSTQSTSSVTTGITAAFGSTARGGSQTTYALMQPTLVLNVIIKY